MYKVMFYSLLLNKYIIKPFENAGDALEFASRVNGIVQA